MEKNRLEAFSDGVIAIIITIMVLELKVPHGIEWNDLMSLVPVFFSYVMSFLYVGVYWNNHHHMLQATKRISGRILWANMHLLFWLSLVPFVTGWMGENNFATIPVVLYGMVLLMAAIAYYILARSLAHHEKNTELANALGRDWKAVISLLFYICAIPLAFIHTSLSILLYIIVFVVWFVPDIRVEKIINSYKK